MDTLATLNVLRDQIVPPEEPLEADDQETRDRLRGLVLNFLTGRGKRHIINPHAPGIGGEAEKALAEALLQVRTSPLYTTHVLRASQVIPILPPPEVETMVKELLMSLPSFSPGSKQGAILMEVILETAKTSCKAEVSTPGEQSSLPRTRIYLDLASDLLQKGLGQATTFLRFYLTNLVSKAALQSLVDSVQDLVIRHVADALKLLLEIPSAPDDRVQMITSTVNGSGFLFAVRFRLCLRFGNLNPNIDFC